MTRIQMILIVSVLSIFLIALLLLGGAFFDMLFPSPLKFIPREKISQSEMKLSLRIESVASKLNKGDEVLIKLIFKNESDKAFWLNIHHLPGFIANYVLIKPSGVTANPALIDFVITGFDWWRIWLGKGFIKLAPGKEFEARESISQLYKFDEIGIYSLKAVYINTNDGGKFNFSAWIGEVESNTATFEIVAQ